MSAPAREILASFGVEVDDEKLVEGKKKIEGFVESLKKLGEAVMVAFAIEKIKEFTFGLAEQAEKLELQSVSLGTSVGALQEWQYAANMVGVGADQLTGAMMRLERAAGGGGKGAGKGLQELGIQAKDAHGNVKPVTQLMDEVAEGISKIEDPSKRTKIAMGLFGKQGAKLIPLFSEGQEGIKKYRDEVKALGGGITEDFVKKSKEMLQNQKRLNFAFLSAKVNIAGALLPSITSFIGKLVALMGWVHQNIDVITAFKSAAVFLAVGGIMKLSKEIGALNLKLLTTFLKVALLAAAFLLIDDAIHFFQGDDSVIGEWLDRNFGAGSADLIRKFFTDFNNLAKTSTDPDAGWGANLVATGALMAGVFKSGTKDAGSFYRVVDGIWRGIVLAGNIAVVELEGGFVHLAAVIGDVFVGIWNTILSGVSAVVRAIGKVDKFLGGSDHEGVAKSIDAAKGSEDMGELTAKARDMDRQKLVDEYDLIAKQLDPQYQLRQAAEKEKVAQVTGTGTRFDDNGKPIPMPGAAAEPGAPGAPGTAAGHAPVNVHAPVSIVVHVAPGTSEEQAKALGKAASDGTQHLRDASVATSPGGPR